MLTKYPVLAAGAIALTITIGTFILVANYQDSKKPTCVAGLNEQCPSDIIQRDWHEYKWLRDKYKAPHDVELRMNGIAVEIQQSTPSGWQWDQNKERYTKIPVQALPQQPQPK